ncbi:hypothetical protein LPJ59_002184 [Coemansia sp. RSA 2399]|nr:hypothetical protein LPJ59_002184 [Coemansia sp. RSA 2399]KAJ1905548.1 hypothetical protein LPJ81_001866 [Coemansia sp. IMI 209127]
MAQLNTTTTDENEALFQELFGSDSSEGDTTLERLELGMAQIQHEALIREGCAIEYPVPGMAVYRNALDANLSMQFFEWLSAKYFSNTPRLQDTTATPNGPRINQGLHFGALSGAAGHTPLGTLAAACVNMKGLLPHSVVASRGGGDGCLFDQAIVNLYDAGEGIGDHIDLLRFADGIVGFSFGGSATMRLRKLHTDEDVERASRYAQEEELGGSASDCVLVRLHAGDVYAMAGDARYRWTHGVPAQIGGRDNVQSRRISVTLRKLA